METPAINKKRNDMGKRATRIKRVGSFLHNRSFVKRLGAARFSKLKLSVRLAMDHACHIACAKSIVNIDDRDSVCA